MNELKSYTEYAVSTPTADFVIGFDFNYGEDAVNVTVDNVPANEAGYTVVYLNETTIRLSPSVPSGVVRLQRETDIDQSDHAYRAGAKFIAQTMDENFEQIRHSQQEVRDAFDYLEYNTLGVVEAAKSATESANTAAQYATQTANDSKAQVDGKLQEFDVAINTIVVGDGVPALAVSDASGQTQQQVNDGLESISDLALIPSPKNHSRVYVKSYIAGAGVGGGELIYVATSTATANNVTIFGTGVGRWIRPLDTVITPYHAGALTGQDSIVALERFGEAFRLSGEKERYLAVGYFKISRPWNFVMKNGGELTWLLKLETEQAMKYATALRGVGMTHLGKLAVVGQGSDNNYNTFTLGYGVVINGCQSSSLPEFSIQRTKYFGVVTDETSAISEIPLGGLAFANNTMMNTPLIISRDTGCSTFGLSRNKTITTTFSNPIHTGTSGSTGQRTTITLSDNVINSSELVVGDFYAVINNKTYQILAVSNTTNTISLFPWLDTTEPTSGTINFFWGGAIKTSGSNVGPFKIGKIDSIRGGINVLDAGLFGSVISNMTTQFLCVGHIIGVSPASLGPQSTSMIGFYTEGVYRNSILISQGSAEYLNRMGEFNGSAFINCEKIRANSRNGDGGAFYDVDGWKRVFMPTQDGNGLDGIYYKGRGLNQDLSGSAIQLSPRNIAPRIYKRDGWTVSLQESEVTNRTKGLDDAVIGFIGSGVNGEPTGTFTFNPPAGWTVNSGASAVFSEFNTPPIFLCYWEVASKNIVVRNSNGGSRQATLVYDPPSIPANGGRVSTTVTLTGAAFGDNISASINRSQAGLQLNSYVSALNTVTVEFINGTASAIDLASLTIKVKIV